MYLPDTFHKGRRFTKVGCDSGTFLAVANFNMDLPGTVRNFSGTQDAKTISGTGSKIQTIMKEKLDWNKLDMAGKDGQIDKQGKFSYG